MPFSQGLHLAMYKPDVQCFWRTRALKQESETLKTSISLVCKTQVNWDLGRGYIKGHARNKSLSTTTPLFPSTLLVRIGCHCPMERRCCQRSAALRPHSQASKETPNLSQCFHCYHLSLSTDLSPLCHCSGLPTSLHSQFSTQPPGGAC